MEDASGQALEGFFAQWLFQGGVPHIEASWRMKDGEAQFQVAQTQATYLFDVKVDVRFRYADGR